MMNKQSAPALLCSTRFNLALIGFLGCVVIYALRTDVSFAIVCMVNATAFESAENNASNRHTSCRPSSPIASSKDESVTGELLWAKDIQGYVLSAFFWGYICSQILGGYLADRYGGKLVIGIVVLGSAILTLVSPLAAVTSVYVFIAVRALLGFFQGAVFPAFHTMWSVWAPPLERSLLTGLTYAGAQVGNTLVMPLSGLLCKYGFAGGWPSIFYVLGVAGIFWSVLWFYHVSDRPSKNKRISEKELSYIEESLSAVLAADSKKKKRPVPRKAIMTSKAIWAIFCGHFAGDWGAYIMMTSLPLFMSDVLGLDFTSLGFLSAVPYIAYFVLINMGGIAADALQNTGLLSTVATRRLAMIVALGGQAVFLIASGYCGCGQDTLVIIFLTLGLGLSGVQYAGFVVNYLDVAPTFAGPILGIGNTISCVAGIICPLLVGWLTPTRSKEEWQIVFWITGAVLVTGVVIFSIFAQGEIQPWALAEPKKEEERELEQKGIES